MEWSFLIASAVLDRWENLNFFFWHLRNFFHHGTILRMKTGNNPISSSMGAIDGCRRKAKKSSMRFRRSDILFFWLQLKFYWHDHSAPGILVTVFFVFCHDHLILFALRLTWGEQARPRHRWTPRLTSWRIRAARPRRLTRRSRRSRTSLAKRASFPRSTTFPRRRSRQVIRVF